MDVSLVSENFHIYILISRHATDTDTGPHSELNLSLSELLPNMLIKEELGGSSPLRVLIFGHFLEIIIELALNLFSSGNKNNVICSIFVLHL